MAGKRVYSGLAGESGCCYEYATPRFRICRLLEEEGRGKAKTLSRALDALHATAENNYTVVCYWRRSR